MSTNHRLKLEEVFKTNGRPTHTFVEPKRYPDILLSLRTPGRCLVVEGPSGIGKTTAIEAALERIGISGQTVKFSARRPSDIQYIELLAETSNAGIVMVDDFHRLPPSSQSKLADYLKVLADSEDKGTKIIILGINRAGDSLIRFAPDLVNRIDIIRFETEPDEKIEELIAKGERSLNLQIDVADDIVREAKGSFYLAQMLCKDVCLSSGVLESSDQPKLIVVSFELIRASVWDRLSLVFRARCQQFCRGTRLRIEGRAPYVHILNWLAGGGAWTLDLREARRRFSEFRGSVGQVVDKGYLKELIESNEDIRQVLHFDSTSQLLTVEDPQFLFYIRNIPWRQFARELGFVSIEFSRRYDFALSFAGPDRDVAESLFNRLSEYEVEVFYDKNEQCRLLAEDIEEYLRPIYQTEAQFVVVLLGPEYPKRIWTRIESNAFKERMSDGAVIPIWFAGVPESAFDSTRKTAGLSFDRGLDMPSQVQQLAAALLSKLGESRQ